nr:GtrA family protein [uncultured Cellulosilyticum sp.]
MKQAKKSIDIYALFKKYKKYILYIVVGGFTTLVNLVIYACARHFKMSMLLANLIAFIGAVIFAYITNKKYVFEISSNKKIDLEEFGKFVGMRVGSFLIETVLLVLIVKVVPFELIVKVFIGIIVVILNYVISNKFIFKKI